MSNAIDSQVKQFIRIRITANYIYFSTNVNSTYIKLKSKQSFCYTNKVNV